MPAAPAPPTPDPVRARPTWRDRATSTRPRLCRGRRLVTSVAPVANEVGHSATGEPVQDDPSPGPRAPLAADPGGRHRAAGHHPAPATTRPGATGARLDGLDAARGLAVLSMLVAHLSPAGGVLDLSEYLTAPLFAVVIGAAMGLALGRPRPARGRFVVDNLARGLLLVLLGLALQPLYGQIDVVLPYLGVLVLVLAPLAVLLRPLPVLTLGLVVAGAVLGPLATERARDAVASGSASSGPVGHLLAWTTTGTHYRLVSFLPMALAGVVLALLLPRLTSLALTTGVAAVLLAASAVVHVLGAGTADGAAAYSGTTAEVVAATFLASGAVVAAAAVVLARDGAPAVGRVLRPVLAPVLSVGRLALTAYTLQILVLALVALVRDGASDDTWAVLAVTAVVVVGGCWLLDRLLGTGPLEVLVRAARLPARGRHGGAVSGRRPPPAPGSPTRSTARAE